mmetsp:Transcript_25328/g.45809  ORF Transcript_25328/g.45809 Transcript_25328/m.45809 type:complete len:126 (+) Transcript_25328:2850-3227(+)
MALIALDKSSSTGKLVAAARLTKEHGRNVAEFSMMVADDYQGEGLGGKLLRELIEHAKADSLDAIEAVVLRTNRAMIHVAKNVGFECVYDKEEGVVKQFLNLRGPHALLGVEETKPRQVSAPIYI